jgi:hypothetical protein
MAIVRSGTEPGSGKGSTASPGAWFRSRPFRILEAFAVVLALGGVYFHDLERVRLHGDESHWISTSYFFESFVAAYSGPAWMPIEGPPRDWSAPGWVLRSLESGGDSPAGVWSAYYWTLTQPPMTRYTIAIGRRLGGYSPADLNGPWDFGLSREANEAAGRMPSPGLLRSARAMMALLAAVSGLLLFLIVRRGAGPLAAYAFLPMYAGSGYLLIHLRRAMSESPLLFWTALALALGARALSGSDPLEAAGGKRRRLAWLLLMGIAAGLAGAVKLNGLALGAVAAAVAGAIAWKRRDAPGAWPMRGGFAIWAAPLTILAAGLAFIAVNPFLYPNPPARSYAMFLFRLWEMSGQSRNPQWLIPDLQARLEIIPRRLFHDYALVKIPILNFALMSAGIYALAHSAWRWLSGKPGTPTIRVSSASLTILLTAAVTAIPPLFSPLDWDRYYLYPVVFSSVFIAAGIAFIARAAWVGVGRIVAKRPAKA